MTTYEAPTDEELAEMDAAQRADALAEHNEQVEAEAAMYAAAPWAVNA